MAIFSSTQPSIKARVLPRFPANVIAGTGITITKNGATYTFALSPITDLSITGLQNIPTDTLIGRDSAGTGDPEILSVSGGLGMTGAGSLELVPNQRLRSLFFNITGAPITTGIKQDYISPFACTITKVTLLADAAPTVNPFILDIWKTPFASYPPVLANSITASLKPTIAVGAGNVKSQLTTLTGWTTSVAVGDCFRFNVETPAPTTTTRVAVCIEVNTV